MVFIAFMFLIYRLRVILSRIILPILQADENILVFFHQLAKDNGAVVIPLLGCPLAVLELAEVSEVLFNHFVLHVFNVLVEARIVKNYFSSIAILVRIPIVQIQTKIAM